MKGWFPIGNLVPIRYVTLLFRAHYLREQTVSTCEDRPLLMPVNLLLLAVMNLLLLAVMNYECCALERKLNKNLSSNESSETKKIKPFLVPPKGSSMNWRVWSLLAPLKILQIRRHSSIVRVSFGEKFLILGILPPTPFLVFVYAPVNFTRGRVHS